jgi:hypothetical protein
VPVPPVAPSTAQPPLACSFGAAEHFPLAGSHRLPGAQSLVVLQFSRQVPSVLQMKGAHDFGAPPRGVEERPSSEHVAATFAHVALRHAKPSAQSLACAHELRHFLASSVHA